MISEDVMGNGIQKVEEWVNKFESITGYFTCDSRLNSFVKKEPLNDSFQVVLEKVSAIGSPSLWQNGEQKKVAQHILQHSIDDRLVSGDLKLVSDLSCINISFSEYDSLHFFSRYCCVHQPKYFPIYDHSTLCVIQTNRLRPGIINEGTYQEFFRENQYGNERLAT